MQGPDALLKLITTPTKGGPEPGRPPPKSALALYSAMDNGIKWLKFNS